MKSTASSLENSGEVFRAMAPVSGKASGFADCQNGGSTGADSSAARKQQDGGGMQKQPHNDPYGTDNPHALDIRASSAQDFTGLIPALPESDAALESYAELYPYPADIFRD